ncbi:flagellar hook-basal body protein [Desulfitobacterium metallireducens]|uniref:Flagellar basal-body rod protein FlgG n=1 Tax=Desulfitobacterium metallireducens DSM 15288 TaxID=871968 RepID=W0EF04_9FIRM|nr:flagellar hook basal-body protein [Desulfitobacterium metallireducens]AHF07764.1 flagellar basal-body rod protein FlgG [Desulfitobacterium metallireducens DSM 15288]
MRLLGTAAGGIRAQQVAMDVVGDNIANVNTPGFKASQPSFAETLSSELRPEGTTMNGAPVGDKVNVGAGVLYNAIGTDFKQGTVVPSDNPLNLAIAGDGFFPVQLPNGDTAFTRVGDFSADANGMLVNSEGQVLALRIPSEVPNGKVDPSGQVTGVLNGENVVLGQVLNKVNAPYSVDQEGRLIDVQGNLAQTGIILPAGASDLSVSSNGIIRGKVNDVMQTLGVVSIVSFPNQGGLERLGGNLFRRSGAGTEGMPIVGLGTIRSQALEQSNVDLANSMTDLIQVQRAYQMNSRMVSYGDQMWGVANSIRR